MNEFLSDHRESFKSFIDDVCTLSTTNSNDKSANLSPTSYSTPLAIRNRLPLTSREGFPSLPYLIDQGREFAGLIELWLQGTCGKDGTEGIANAIGQEDGDLLGFHNLCTKLHARTQECLSRAERAERPSSALSFRWEELIDQLQTNPTLAHANHPLRSKEDLSEADKDEARESALQHADLDVETPTRESFDDAAMRAAGEAAARARGALADDEAPEDVDSDDLLSPRGFEDDKDGGAAFVAASMLQQEKSTQSLDRRAGMHFRGSFDMNNGAAILSGPSSITSAGSGSMSLGQGSSSGARDTTISSTRDRLERDREIARDIEASLSGGKRHAPGSASGAFSATRGTSAHGSASGSLGGSETDSNATTALPSWTREKERRAREKEKLKKKEKEERERRLKDFVPLAGMVGGFRKGRKDKKDKEKEDRGPGD